MAVPTLSTINVTNFGTHLNRIDAWIKAYPTRTFNRIRLAMAVLSWLEAELLPACNCNGINSDACDACRGEHDGEELPF